jgi:hypothetical protein
MRKKKGDGGGGEHGIEIDNRHEKKLAAGWYE